MATQKPRVNQETDYTYTNKFSSRRLRFSPKADEVVVTLQAGSDEASARGVMEATRSAISKDVDLQRGFAVFEVHPDSDVSSAMDSLSAQPQVLNSMPAMIDDENLARYFLPDEFTVQFAAGVRKEQAEQIIRDMGSHILVEQRTPGYYTLAVPEGKGLFQSIREFSDLDEVLFAEPSEVGFDDELVYIPNDTDLPKLWGLHNTGQTVDGVISSADADIDAVQAWDITRGDPDVIAAVIDTGADLDHPDLQANFLPRGSEDWDFADLGDSVPADSHSHGTHVAGTIAGVDNLSGVIGVAPKCRIMPLRVNLTSGMNANRADAINYVATQALAHPERRYVINCSWRMSGDHAGVHNAIINAVNNNVVVVFAAGNAHSNIDVQPQYPAVYPEVIAVAATDQKDVRAWFSNYGGKVDVSAPGENIYSTVPDNAYGFKDGTSMASPHVAGLAALIWSRNSTLTNQQVRDIIESTCDNIDAKNPAFVGKLGKGRINAFRALSATPLPGIKFKVVRKFKFPQKNAGSSTGLAFARRLRIWWWYRPALLFLTQQPYSERVYYMNPSTGSVMSSVDPVGNDTLGCLDWDGRNIRAANVTWGTGFINTINPYTGVQVNSMSAPPGRGEGLASNGRYLYYSTISLIHVIDSSTGAVVNSFPAPGGACRSLTYGRGYLFSGNSSTGLITVFDPSTLAVRGTKGVEGLAFNPYTNELFVANQSENVIYVGEVTL